MLTLTSQTIQRVGSNYEDSDDDKWRGAAKKYLATYNGRDYLVKPDLGWPSDSARERIAAAFYRAVGVRTANCVRASVDGTSAVAVRIIPNASPIGDDMVYLTHQEGMDVVLGVFAAAMVGDGDKHCYNFIHDGEHAYSIDHGLAFNGTSAKVNYTGGEHITTLTESGVVTWQDVRDILADMPDNTGTLAELAYSHAEVPSSVSVNGWREIMAREIERLEEDEDSAYDDEDYSDEDEDDSGHHDPDHMTWNGKEGWHTCQTQRDQVADNALAIMWEHDNRVLHNVECPPCQAHARLQECNCRNCPRPLRWGPAVRCATFGRFMHRKASDPVKRISR